MKIGEFLKKNFIGVIFTFIFLGLIFYNLDFKTFYQDMLEYKVKYVLIFCVFYLANLYIKGIKWKLLVNNDKLSYIKSFLIFSVSNTLNICAPCRFGDFWKAYSTAKITDSSKSEALGTVITERAIDFLSVVCILIFIVFKYLKNDLTLKLLHSSLIFCLCFVLGVVFLFAFQKYIIKIKFVSKIVQGLKSVGSFKKFVLCFLIALFTRLIECILVWFLLLGASIHIGFSSTLFVIVFNALAGMIPSVSNYIGAYQYSYILALGLYGVTKTLSLEIVLIYEFVTLAVLGIITIVYFWDKLKQKLKM